MFLFQYYNKLKPNYWNKSYYCYKFDFMSSKYNEILCTDIGEFNEKA